MQTSTPWLNIFVELHEFTLEALTKNRDPYWDVSPNESLPEPVIELPVPQVDDEQQ